MKVLSRAKAKQLGLTRYFTGKPCIHGHVSERRTSNSTCQVCHIIRWWIAYRKAGGWPSTRKAFILKNIDKTREGARRRYNQDPSKQAEASLKYNRSNPDKRNSITRNHRARKIAAVGTHTSNDISFIFKQQSGICAGIGCHCDLRFGYSVDHIMPLSRGGSNWPDNLQLLCIPCNSSKCDKTMDEWQGRQVA